MAVMAIPIERDALAAALRLGSSTEELAEASRLLTYATEAVTRYAPAAPTAAKNEAIIRISGYLFDMPNAGAGVGYSNALRNSGAAAILLPYRVHRAGIAAEAAPDGMTGTPGNPVVDVTVSGAVLTVTYTDGTTAERALPTGGGPSGPAVDQTARNEAAAASQSAAVAAQAAGTAQRAADAAAAAANANTTFLSTFMDRVRAVVVAVVPAWARAADPPDGRIEFVPADRVTQRVHGVTGATEFVLTGVQVPEDGRGFGFFTKEATAEQSPFVVIGEHRGEIDHLDGTEITQAIPAFSYFEIVRRGTLPLRYLAATHDNPGNVQVPAASESVRGGVVLARTADVADSETDLSRVPTVARAIALIRRLIGENVRSVPEVEAAHIGRPLVAIRADETPGWQKLTGAGIADNTVAEGNLTADARTKLNARGGGTTDAQARRDIATEAQTRADADTALGERIDGKQATLTHAQRIDLLQFTIVPQVVIGYTADDVTLDWRVSASGGETLPDTWMSLHLDGLPTLAAPVPTTPGADLSRHKLSATVIYQYTFATANRKTLVDGRTGRRQGRSISAEIRFYDAVTGGNIVDRRVIGIDWLPAPTATAAPMQRWYVLGQARIARNNTANEAVNLALQTRSGQQDFAIDGKFANYAAVKAAADAGEITQVAVRLIEIDGTGSDNDEETHIKPINSWFSEANSIKVFDDFQLGQNPKKITLAFGASAVTVTPDFSFQGDGGAQAALVVRLAVWA